jgi:hypothetical protein
LDGGRNYATQEALKIKTKEKSGGRIDYDTQSKTAIFIR